MSTLLLIALITVVVFACMFGLCEWVARRRDSGGEAESFAAQGSPGGSAEHADAAQLAARRRMARQLGVNIDGGPNSSPQ